MLIGALKMHLNLTLILNYQCLLLGLCQHFNLLGPIHWLSKQQMVTAGSSAEAEIYTTDECVKFLLELSQIMEFLEVKDIFMPGMNVIYNDNKACMQWSKVSTTKGLRQI
jgi:hypothetical protein